jgi:hypothetical protein
MIAYHPAREVFMKRLTSVLLGVALVAALLAAAPAIRAETEEKASGARPNIMVTFRIGKLEEGKRIQVKAYDLVAADGMRGSTLLSGARMPFPTSEGEGEMQAYVYHNVGFTTSVEAKIIGKDKILLRADIEDSRIREDVEGEPPIVETRQLSVNVVLADGVPLALTRVEGLSDQPGYVEVEAIILK